MKTKLGLESHDDLVKKTFYIGLIIRYKVPVCVMSISQAQSRLSAVETGSVFLNGFKRPE